MNILYVLPFSHPAIAARLMLEGVGVEHRVVKLPSGFHPAALRLLGFPRGTVPALRLDGRRVQGSLEISRAADARSPGVLFPEEPAARRRVEDAERWAESELQPIPRRLFRWTLMRDSDLRRRFLRTSGVPLAGAAAVVMRPVIGRLARIASADDATVREDARRLPALVDRIDGWIADGTIGGERPNAADFQIATTVQAMRVFEDLRPHLEGRPAVELARRIVPDYPVRVPPVLDRLLRLNARP